jgi:hypothetical protein
MRLAAVGLLAPTGGDRRLCRTAATHPLQPIVNIIITAGIVRASIIGGPATANTAALLEKRVYTGWVGRPGGGGAATAGYTGTPGGGYDRYGRWAAVPARSFYGRW